MVHSQTQTGGGSRLALIYLAWGDPSISRSSLHDVVACSLPNSKCSGNMSASTGGTAVNGVRDTVGARQAWG